MEQANNNSEEEAPSPPPVEGISPLGGASPQPEDNEDLSDDSEEEMGEDDNEEEEMEGESEEGEKEEEEEEWEGEGEEKEERGVLETLFRREYLSRSPFFPSPLFYSHPHRQNEADNVDHNVNNQNNVNNNENNNLFNEEGEEGGRGGKRGWEGDSSFVSAFYSNDHLIRRLQLDRQITGHEGCVNTVNWNDSGDLLLSSGDDTDVLLYDFISEREKAKFETEHEGNVFCARFIDQNDQTIATCAADGAVYAFNLLSSSSPSPSRPSSRSPAARSDPSKLSAKKILSCRGCHEGRVKKLALLYHSHAPLFLSCGEDGKLIEYDMRAPHSCGASMVVVNKRKAGWNSISSHPSSPYSIYVAGSAPSIFHFDLRKPNQICSLVTHPRPKKEDMGITGIAQSSRGDEIIATYSRDKIFLFDLLSHSSPPPPADPNLISDDFDLDLDGDDDRSRNLIPDDNKEEKADAEGSRERRGYKRAYSGHCNIKTVKCVNFYSDDNYIVSGSDCKSIFIWDKLSARIVNVISSADSYTVNCLVGNPREVMTLATSGIDKTVKIWRPTAPSENDFSDTLPRLLQKNKKSLQFGDFSDSLFRLLLNSARVSVENEDGESTTRVTCPVQ